MKISTKGRYGLRAMVDLAVYSLGDQVTLKSIAQRQSISENYLEQVFSILRKAELVKSIKGAQGGYIIGKSPENITVGDILRALEGSLSVVEDASESTTDEIELCINNNVWNKINDCINTAVDSVSLEDLVVEYKKLKGDSSYLYYI